MMFSPLTEGLEMHAPVLVPDGGIDGGKDRAPWRARRGRRGNAARKTLRSAGWGTRKLGVFDGDDAAAGIDARAGHDAVEVRVEVQALVPGVEDHGEAAGLRAEPAGIGERVGQGGGGGGEEE